MYKVIIRKAMKRLSLTLIFITISFFATARDFKVYGPQGGLAMEVTLPDDFNEDTDKCPMVILMHGIFSSKNIVPVPALARALAKEGIASICFDFGGHWKSEGKMELMTVGKEIEDAYLRAEGNPLMLLCWLLRDL